jgi:hypothetical protein
MNPPLQHVEEKLRELAAETDAMRKSAEFQHYLDTMARFWQYSYRNQLLIHFALPSATRVAGFKAWQSLGRRIKKGAKAIPILGPVTRLEKQDDGSEKELIVNFRPVNVFDISQTEGKELPHLDVTLQGDDQQKLLNALSDFCEVKKIALDFKNLGVNGLYGYSQGGKVVISSKNSVNTQVNTLVHEIAHELLHHPSHLSEQQKEIEAEGTAYVVCKHFGLKTKSFTYLAMYKADSKEIMAHLEAIARASKEVIEFIFLFYI